MQTMWGDKTVELDWKSSIETFNGLNEMIVTSVHAIPFINKDHVFLVQHETRGWEIPGGHIEPGENPRDALFRELVEEAAIQGTPELLGSIQVNNGIDPNFVAGKYPTIGHQLFYRLNVSKVDPFPADFETLKRDVFHVDDVKKFYGNWTPMLEQAFLESAQLEKHVENPDFVKFAKMLSCYLEPCSDSNGESGVKLALFNCQHLLSIEVLENTKLQELKPEVAHRMFLKMMHEQYTYEKIAYPDQQYPVDEIIKYFTR